jgi:peptide/nickel transport system substrate-binding protein
MRRRFRQLIVAAGAVCALVVACGPVAAPPAAPASGRAEQQSGTTRKAMVMATTTEPAHLGGFQVVGTGYQGPIYQMVHDFLVVHDDQGQPHPHLAESLPSREDGSWKVLPDGTMETVWRLRSGPKWHDGTPLSTHDIAFTWKVANDPEIPWSRPAYARRIAEISAPDANTLVMRWKGTFPFAHRPEETTIDPIPTHLLESQYGADTQGFINSPYWTRDFIGLGPYRITAWQEGSHLELVAVDDHYAGRAKIDAITVRFIPDPNALMANLLSRAVDANIAPTDLDYQHWSLLRQQWPEGKVMHDTHGTFRFLGANQRVRPFEDLRIRRALAHAVDREAILDALLVPRTQLADAMVAPGSARAQLFRDKMHVYPYDPIRAQAYLDEAGWRRGGDGVVRDAEGRTLEFEFRSSDETLGTVVMEMWKALGLSVNLVVPGPALMRDREWQANVKGVEASGFGLSFGMWERRMHSSSIPVSDNRWAGTNRRYYANRDADSLTERLNVTLDSAERDRIEGELIERVTRDAVVAPIYVDAPASVYRKEITGHKPMAGLPIIVSRYYGTWNILEWDRSDTR